MNTEISAFEAYTKIKEHTKKKSPAKTKPDKHKSKKRKLDVSTDSQKSKKIFKKQKHCPITNSDKQISPKLAKKVLPQTIKIQTKKKSKIVRKNISNKTDDKPINGDLPENAKKVKVLKKKKHNKENTNKEYMILDLDCEDSMECGLKLFNWTIAPLTTEKFFKHNWEIRPLHITRHCPTYYSTLLSCEIIDRTLREKMLYFGKNIDITSYTNGQRETHNVPGRANAPQVWDFFNQGCSIRILNPQTFFKKMHLLNSRLQEYFGCFVGANVYLTPAGTQGFAPHYDDIEAFVLQIEGKKLWKLYAPVSSSEILPRVSSKNFTQEELGPKILEVVLEPGDLLYFPRGIVHQASALEETHSLHITLSVYQKNSWADLLSKLLPAALSQAAEEDVAFRRGLPMHYLRHAGVVHCDKESEERTQFLSTLQELITKLVSYAPVDAAVDQMGKDFIIDSLPVFISKKEKARTVFGDGERIAGGVVRNVAEMDLDTRIKLLRYNAIRLVTEEDGLRLYYSVNNSLEYHGEDPQFLDVEEESAPSIEYLMNSYPEYVTVENLPLKNDDEKVRLATALWEVGLLITDLPIGEETSSDEH